MMQVQMSEEEFQERFNRLLQDNPETPTLESRVIDIDAEPAESGSKKTQDGWVTYWNGVNDGCVFASIPDLYAGFKLLKHQIEHGNTTEKALAEKIIESLREDFKGSWLISSTRINYQTTGLESEIIHHYNCKNTALITRIPKIIIKEYCPGKPINEVLNDKQGLAYMQALLGTTDNPKTITETLTFISGKPKEQTLIWTPPVKTVTGYKTRAEKPCRAVDLLSNGVGFLVSSYGRIDYPSRSRGVRLK